MRLLSLRLPRFGEFVDQPAVGDFLPGLNLVYAPNEGGKSTLLGALRYGLFGADVKDYAIEGGQREVELRLVRDERQWTLTRREGRGASSFDLRADDGTQVRKPEFDDQWLCHLKLGAYQSLYALSLDDLRWHDELRNTLLLAEAGELGVRLRQAANAAKKRGDELFTPESKRLPLNLALSEWQEATRQVKAASQQPAALDRLRRELAACQAAAADLAAQRETAQSAADHARRLVAALPRRADLAALQLRETELADVEGFPPTAPDEFRRAAEAAEAAAEQVVALTDGLRQTATELAELAVDDRWLAAAEALERGGRRALELAQWPRELRVAEEGAAAARAAAADVTLRHGGPGTGVEQLAALDVSALARTALAAQAAALQAADEAVGLTQQRLEQATREQQERDRARRAAEEAHAKLPEPLDAAGLTALRRVLRREPDLRAAVQAGRADEAAASARQSELRSQRQREEAARTQAEAARLANEQTLAAAQPGRPPLGARVLVGVLVVALLGAGVVALLHQETLSGGLDLAAGVGFLLLFARLTASVVLPPISFQVTVPLTVTDEALAQAAARIAASQEALGEAQRRLHDLAAEAGLPVEAAAETWRERREQVESELADHQRREADRRQAATRLEEAQRALLEAAERLAAATADHEAALAARDVARATWRDWLTERGLDPAATVDVARAWLDAAQQVQQHLATARQAAELAAARRAELETLRDELAALAAPLGVRLSTDDPWGLDTARVLIAELERQQALARQREALAAAQAASTAELAQATEARQRAEAQQATALARARAVDEDDLLRRATLAQELSGVQQQRREAAAALRGTLDEAGWAAWQAELAATDAELAAPAAAEAADTLATVSAAAEAKQVERGELLNRERQLTTAADLATAQMALEQATAQVRELAHQWAVARAAGALIEQTLREHEAARQPERVTRIGELLRHLTAGRWTGVLARDGELVAVRADGDVVRPPAQLSRGTRDALFLCARIAALEARLDTIPLPVALDDTLVNLDQCRRPRMAELLAGLAQRTQVIVFTCHDDLPRELADRGLAHHVIPLPEVI